MATSRTSIIRGPGAVQFGGVTIFDASGITADITTDSSEIPSSISGPLGSIKTNQTASIQFTPCGQLDANILAKLYPHQTPAIGSSLCGSSDAPCVVHSLAGTKVTFFNAFLSAIPELILSPVQTAFGPCTLTALTALGKAPGEENAFAKVESAAYALGYPSPANLTGVKYSGTYGELTIPDTASGWTVSVDIGTAPVGTDNTGIIDHTLSSVTVRARCTPVGLTETQILGALPLGLGRGASLAGASDLVITGEGGLTVTLKNAQLVQGPLAWGSTTLRAGEIGFVATRSFANGVAGELYSVALASAQSNP